MVDKFESRMVRMPYEIMCIQIIVLCEVFCSNVGTRGQNDIDYYVNMRYVM